MKKKKKVWIGVGVASLIVIFAIVAIVRGSFGTTDEVYVEEESEILVQKVKEEALEETILVTGKIIAADEQKIYLNPELGEIKQFEVEENDKVKAGDTLFYYDGSQMDHEFNAAVRNRTMAENQVLMIQNQMNQLTKQIDQMKKLQGNPVDEETGEVVSAEDIRQLELERNQLSLELEGAKAEVANIQAEINEIDKRKQTLSVKSNIDGTIVKVNKNNERSDDGLNEPVIHIVSDAPFKVIGTMSEYDTVKIKPEQSVVVRPKVFKDREWKGIVETVSAYPTDDGGGGMDMYAGDMSVTMYPFMVAITDDTSDLRQGFHVSLEINVGGSDKKLVVPHMALMDEMMLGMGEDVDFMDELFGTGFDFMNDDTQFVYVLVDGVLEKRDIETGKMSDEFVEIISGVELGEFVVINPTPNMYDGMEVTQYDEVD